MNIHHKNMKQVSQEMQSWTKSNLTYLGIYECNYAHFDLNEASWAGIPMYYDWYCEYMEQGLDLSLASRLSQGTRYWDQTTQLYQKYNHFINTIDTHSPHRLDVITKTDDGFEMLTVSSDHLLTPSEHLQVEKALRVLSHQARYITKNKPNLTMDLRCVNELKNIEFEKEGPCYSQYEKSKFGDVILTSKEQKYIEYMIFNKTQKEIAYLHSCSETAVRKVITNIKRKLGHEFMPNSQMMDLLGQIGVLSICSQSFIVN